MDAPIVRVHIAHNERDISDRIESFSFEDCIKEDDIVTLKIKVGYVLETADDADFVTGTLIRFQYGFAGKRLSVPGLAKITDVEVTYAERITMTVKATAVSNSMKKLSVLGGVNGKSAADLIKDYARETGMKYQIDEPVMKHKNLTITGNTFETLQKCASLEPSGDYACYVKGDTIFYVKRKWDAVSSLTFIYGEPGFISFSPKFKETSAKGASNESVGVAVDPKTKETKVQPNENTDPALGKNLVLLSKGGTEGSFRTGAGYDKSVYGGTMEDYNKQQDAKKGLEKETTKKIDPVPAVGTGSSTSSTKKNKRKVLTATLVINGNPLITPNSVVTIQNVAQRHAGNWLVEKVKQEISAGSPYKTTLEMTRNGVNKASSNNKQKADTMNNTQGPKEQNKTVIKRSAFAKEHDGTDWNKQNAGK